VPNMRRSTPKRTNTPRKDLGIRQCSERHQGLGDFQGFSLTSCEAESCHAANTRGHQSEQRWQIYTT
jgi:hypothetical protein